MAATWEEIKRLAADFQRAQLSVTTQKLAERNCHEIVSKLIELKLIEVIYTSDGKSYLTPKELVKEIQEEIIVHGGRVNLVTLQQSINVDMSHIENKVHEMVSQDDDLQFILGQIIHVSYIEQLCRDLNDQLLEVGQTTFAELTKQYNLPGDFLKREITARLGTYIFGKIDPSNNDVLYTETYINRHRARVRGIFSALIRPTNLSSVISRYGIPERLLISLVSDLIGDGRLKGSLSSNKATYTPAVYTEAQRIWIDNFFTQNGYLEFDSLTRLGIPDPKQYIKKTYKNAIILSACCVSEACLEGLAVSIEDCLSTDTFMNAVAHLPSVISTEDGAQLVQMCLKSHKKAVVLGDTIVTTQDFINRCAAHFDPVMEEKATKDMKTNASVFADSGDKKSLMSFGDDHSQSKKDERKKKAAAVQKAGGGTQGREVKSKAVKSKFKGRNNAKEEDEDEEMEVQSSSGQKILEFMSVDQIREVINKLPELKESPEDMREEIAGRLYRPLRDKYQDVAKNIFFRLSASQSSGTASKRKQLAAVEEKINTLYNNIKLCDKSIRLIQEDEDLVASLAKYLLKTTCTEICNELVDWVAADHMVTIPDDALDSVEGRAKVISNLPDNIKGVTGKVHTALNGKSVDAFDEALLELLSPQHIGIMLKKSDKKRDRQILFNHKLALMEQLKEEQDLPSAFHLVVVVLFGSVHQAILHCTGKMIPQVLKQLRTHITTQQYQTLTECQDVIIQQVKGEIAAEDDRLKECLVTIKELASLAKKMEITA